MFFCRYVKTKKKLDCEGREREYGRDEHRSEGVFSLARTKCVSENRNIILHSARAPTEWNPF